MSDEASNILRRFVRVAAQLDPTELRYLKKAARTLDPGDLRQLAREIYDSGRPLRLIKYGTGGRPHATSITELRGLARSIIRYGGPDAVRRDADPLLVEAVNRMGWTP